MKTDHEINLEILSKRVALLNEVEGPRVGDYLKLPNNTYTRFTESWGHHIQTGGGSNSYYLGNGYCSYSGSLDSGVKLTDIRLTQEVKDGEIWFFERDWHKADNAVYYSIPFRVYELIEGADTSGIPQIAKYEKEQYLKTLPTITRINGNFQVYILPVPEIAITGHITKELLSLIEDLQLKESWERGLKKVQLTTLEQYEGIMSLKNYSTKMYNNWQYQNMLLLEYNG